MRRPQGAARHDGEVWVSKLQVMRSAAGYYVGRAFYEEDGTWQPYDRQSGYYRTEDDAQRALDTRSYD